MKESIERIWRDVRLALRSLRRSPTFTVTTIAILALGIGMSTAMFTIYKTVLIDRLPIVAQDRLVVMHPLDRRGMHLDAPYPYLTKWRATARFFVASPESITWARGQPRSRMESCRSGSAP